MQVLHKE